ncbi:hypothetical protein F11_19395 [Rhodospirillum rubrum F11]|uniref:Peroxiredoxin family protein n=1 Tax=Rhodospirillum rubrum (strain ATCC 11170 / ATH 1.1.1 / DSM 467 / LMG 4362 / NCIMB 8255 / S1) TaxID=269796 RepID=Q2RMQ9_RHORT|nr:DsrE/DsrF/DrsH-like family protein [Rhodospirillum rubrum]ABC24586.1 conserved hypothetical protein [Rhodospirillum rubrum ATCC 11170]AEO50339.1 hypothetical protein F11_19395 [Rhodospirillum rubrum F11]MBK5956318.1 hypothetical protein [Rhodospirillum rubrum]QXG80500.1 DsrE/DsrF/DrsH-like family protein [Rhodospirillum rubrum]
MPGDPAAPAPGIAGLSAVVLSDAFERVHYALVLASAAAALGQPALLFFTLGATRALARTARPSTPPPGVTGDVSPGWRALAPSPGHDTALAQDQALAARGVADFETLLEACVALGVRFVVCEAGLRAIALTPADLRDDLPCEVAGAVTWLTETPAGAATLMV